MDLVNLLLESLLYLCYYEIIFLVTRRISKTRRINQTVDHVCPRILDVIGSNFSGDGGLLVFLVFNDDFVPKMVLHFYLGQIVDDGVQKCRFAASRLSKDYQRFGKSLLFLLQSLLVLIDL